MIIYYCDSCEIEWGWDASMPPPRALTNQGRDCPICGWPGTLAEDSVSGTPYITLPPNHGDDC